jgi:peroxiredoxin/outer membrane lipoprotein-sorting protein
MLTPRALILALSLFAAAGLPAIAHQEAAATAPATDGKAAFQRAADEVAKVQGIMYDAKLTVLDKAGTGPATSMLANYTHDMTLSITQLRLAGSLHAGWISRAKGTFTKDKAEQQLDVAWKSGSIELVKFADKKVEEKAGKGLLGPGVASAMNARMSEAFSASPFSAELALAEFTLEGEKTIAGEVCDVVLITDRNKRPVRWAFARSDGLPRMREVQSTGMTEGIVRVELSNVRVDRNTPSDINEDMIKVDVPEGFKEERPAVVQRQVTPVEEKSPLVEPNPMSTPPTDPVKPARDPVTPQGDPIPAGPKAAADFELSTPAGEKVKLSDLKGSAVVLQFFGSWCLPCKDWHTKLAPAATAAGDVKLYALSVRERDNANAASELAAAGNKYTHLINADEVAKLYDVAVYPTTIVIDREGIIRLTISGETSDEAATQITESLRSLAATPVATANPIK